MSATWRKGRTLGVTLYEGDRFVGTMQREEDADVIARGVKHPTVFFERTVPH